MASLSNAAAGAAGGTATATNWFVPKSSCASCSSSNHKNLLRLSRRTGFAGLAYCCNSSHNNNTKNNNNDKKKGVQNSNYVVPLEKSFSSASSSYMIRPLVEILRDLNKRIPDNVIDSSNNTSSTFISWYNANRMLSFYAPGWCGEVRDVIFSENGSVTVVYRVTLRGSDGEAHREATGTVSSSDSQVVDPVTAAEEIAFCKACARFGLGLYLYHDE